jgi:hypothetical protein
LAVSSTAGTSVFLTGGVRIGGAMSGLVICFVDDVLVVTDRRDPAICGDKVGGPGDTRGLVLL